MWKLRRAAAAAAAAGTWLTPSPPGVPLPGPSPPPLPSRKYARRVGTLSAALFLRASSSSRPRVAPPRLFCWRLAQDPRRDLGQAGEKREGQRRPQLPECRNRPLPAKSSPLGTRDLPPLSPSEPRLPQRATQIPTPGEGHATRDEMPERKVFRLLRPLLYIPLQLPPSSFPDPTRPVPHPPPPLPRIELLA